MYTNEAYQNSISHSNVWRCAECGSRDEFDKNEKFNFGPYWYEERCRICGNVRIVND